MITLRFLAGITVWLIIVAASVTLWRRADDDARWTIKALAPLIAAIAGLTVTVCLAKFAATGSLK